MAELAVVNDLEGEEAGVGLGGVGMEAAPADEADSVASLGEHLGRLETGRLASLVSLVFGHL